MVLIPKTASLWNPDLARAIAASSRNGIPHRPSMHENFIQYPVTFYIRLTRVASRHVASRAPVHPSVGKRETRDCRYLSVAWETGGWLPRAKGISLFTGRDGKERSRLRKKNTVGRWGRGFRIDLAGIGSDRMPEEEPVLRSTRCSRRSEGFTFTGCARWLN